eukprot:Clim_evm8s108 gene=Clim_evmTU8s108
MSGVNITFSSDEDDQVPVRKPTAAEIAKQKERKEAAHRAAVKAKALNQKYSKRTLSSSSEENSEEIREQKLAKRRYIAQRKREEERYEDEAQFSEGSFIVDGSDDGDSFASSDGGDADRHKSAKSKRRKKKLRLSEGSSAKSALAQLRKAREQQSQSGEPSDKGDKQAKHRVGRRLQIAEESDEEEDMIPKKKTPARGPSAVSEESEADEDEMKPAAEELGIAFSDDERRPGKKGEATDASDASSDDLGAPKVAGPLPKKKLLFREDAPPRRQPVMQINGQHAPVAASDALSLLPRQTQSSGFPNSGAENHVKEGEITESDDGDGSIAEVDAFDDENRLDVAQQQTHVVVYPLRRAREAVPAIEEESMDKDDMDIDADMEKETKRMLLRMAAQEALKRENQENKDKVKAESKDDVTKAEDGAEDEAEQQLPQRKTADAEAVGDDDVGESSEDLSVEDDSISVTVSDLSDSEASSVYSDVKGRGEDDVDLNLDVQDDMGDYAVIDGHIRKKHRKNSCRCGLPYNRNYDGLMLRCSSELCDRLMHACCYNIRSKADRPPGLLCDRCRKAIGLQLNNKKASSKNNGKGVPAEMVVPIDQSSSEYKLYIMCKDFKEAIDGGSKGAEKKMAELEKKILELLKDAQFEDNFYVEWSHPDEKGETLLHKIIALRSPSLLEAIMANGAHIEIKDATGLPALFVPCVQGVDDAQILEDLIIKFVYKCIGTRCPIAKELQEKEKITPADYSDARPMLRDWLSTLYDGDGNTVLHYATRQGSQKCIDVIVARNLGQLKTDIKDQYGNTALYTAAAIGSAEFCLLLSRHGGYLLHKEPETKNTVMHAACASGTMATVKVLFDPLKVGTKLLDVKNEEGFTPMATAVQCGHAHLVKYLLDTHHAQLAPRDVGGATPLHVAAINGESECVKVLLERGHPADATDSAGWPPILYADWTENVDVVAQLIESCPEQLKIFSSLLKQSRPDPLLYEKTLSRINSVLESLATVPRYRRQLNTFVRQNPTIIFDPAFSFLGRYSGFLDFDLKVAYLKTQLEPSMSLDQALGVVNGSDSSGAPASANEEEATAVLLPGLGLGGPASRTRAAPEVTNRAATKTPSLENFHFAVGRERPFLDVYEGLDKRARENDQSLEDTCRVPVPAIIQIRITIDGEEQASGPGVLREFFSMVAKDVVNTTRYGLIKSAGTNSRGYMPLSSREVGRGDFAENLAGDRNRMLMVLGFLMGLSIRCGVVFPVPLARPFAKELLRKSLVLEDWNAVDPHVYKNLSWLHQQIEMRKKRKKQKLREQRLKERGKFLELEKERQEKDLAEQQHKEAMDAEQVEADEEVPDEEEENIVPIEDLGLTFSYEVRDMDGKVHVVRLPDTDGEEQEVKASNALEYITQRTQHQLATENEGTLRHVRRGLRCCISPKQHLHIFNGDELSLLIAGADTIDIEDWKKHTIHEGFGRIDRRGMEVVNKRFKLGLAERRAAYFWQLVETLSESERAQLLQFTTGSATVSGEGFKAMDPPFRLVCHRALDRESLPTANTCINRFVMPPYDSYQQLEAKVLVAIWHGSQGFSFI